MSIGSIYADLVRRPGKILSRTMASASVIKACLGCRPGSFKHMFFHAFRVYGPGRFQESFCRFQALWIPAERARKNARALSNSFHGPLLCECCYVADASAALLGIWVWLGWLRSRRRITQVYPAVSRKVSVQRLHSFLPDGLGAGSGRQHAFALTSRGLLRIGVDHATHSLTSIKEPKNKDLDIITKCSRLRTDGWFEEEGIKPLRRCWRYLPELSFVAFLLQVLIFLSQAHLLEVSGSQEQYVHPAQIPPGAHQRVESLRDAFGDFK